jgi:hypothetical protein
MTKTACAGEWDRNASADSTADALQDRASDGTNRLEYLLAELRCAVLRARLMQADLVAVGLALKGGLITADQAVALLSDCDLLRLIGPQPTTPDGP